MNILKLFKKDTPAPAKLPSSDVAWAESMMYGGTQFEKYNPDDLIGRKGYGIYRRMLQDEQVKAVVNFKRDAITSRDWYFEAPEDLAPKKAEKRIKISEQIVAKMQGSFLDSLNGVMTAIYHGFSITEKNFTQIEINKKTYWGLSTLKLRPYDTFTFHTDVHGNITKVTQKLNGKEQQIDLKKFIHYVNNPAFDEHYGSSELREAYRPWFSKDKNIMFYNMYLERSASGYKWMTPKEGHTIRKGTQEYNDAIAILNHNTAGNGMLLPSNIEFHMEYPTANVEYKTAIDLWDMHIARALLVPNLLGITPSGQTGSYSQSENQLEAFMWTLDADASRLEEALNEQLFRQLGLINFGDDDWPRFRFKPVSESKKMAIINTWKDLVTAGAVKASESDEAHLRDLLDMPERTEEVLDDTGSGKDIPLADGAGSDDGGAGDSGNNNPASKEPDKIDETIIGRTRASVSSRAYARAQARVDFAVIARNSESLEDEHVINIAAYTTKMVEEALIQAKQKGTVAEYAESNIKLTADQKTKAKLNSALNKMLQDGWKLGTRHAQIEIDKAKGLVFSKSVDKQHMNFIAEDFFKIKAFKMTGNFTQEALGKIEQVILNGAKYDKTWDQVEADIYQRFASDGMLSEADAKEALGEALGNIKNPDARIRTVVRTGTFEAINEARYAYFSSPELDGFVEAQEYSAILDSRTTQICQHLDGTTHSLDFWGGAGAQFRPPNHYNCRSLLIPITEVDVWTEDEVPTLQPQKGFE